MKQRQACSDELEAMELRREVRRLKEENVEGKMSVAQGAIIFG